MDDSAAIRVFVPYDALDYAISSQAVMRGLLLNLVVGAVGMYAALEGYRVYLGLEVNWYGLGAVTLFCFMFYGLITSRRYLAWQIRRSSAHIKPEDLATTWEIDGASLRYSSVASSGTFDWTSVLKVVRIPEGFLIVPRKGMAFWLPKARFESAGAQESFAELCRGKCRTYKDKSSSFFPTA